MRRSVPKKARITWAIQRAQNLLREAQITSLPVDPFEIYSLFDWDLYTCSEVETVTGKKDPLSIKKHKADAKTYRDRQTGVFITVYDETHLFERIRWTLAHEIAHIYLGHLTDFDITDLNRGLNNDEYKVLEKEANYFAAELLAPLSILKSIGAVRQNEIKRICKISKLAASNREDQIKRSKKINNAQVHLLLHFKNYIFKEVNKKSCFVCDYTFVSKDSLFCPICGSDQIYKGIGDIMKYPGIEVDENSKAIECPNCKNHEIIGAYCHICGTFLINKCTGFADDPTDRHIGPLHYLPRSCEAILEGNARFCVHCGSTSTYYESGLLKSWKQTQNEMQSTDQIFGPPITINDDDLPF